MSVIYQALRKISPAREGEGAEGDAVGEVKPAPAFRSGQTRMVLLVAGVLIVTALLAAGYFLILPAVSTSPPPKMHRPPPVRTGKSPAQQAGPAQPLQEAPAATPGVEVAASAVLPAVEKSAALAPLPEKQPEQTQRPEITFAPKSAAAPQYFPKKSDQGSGESAAQVADNKPSAAPQEQFQAVVQSLRTAKKTAVPAAEQEPRQEPASAPPAAEQAALPPPSQSQPPASPPSLPRTLLPNPGGQQSLAEASTAKTREAGSSSQAESRTASITGLTSKIEQAILGERDEEVQRLLAQLAAVKGEESDFVLKIKAFNHLHKGEYAPAAELLTRVLANNANDVEAAVNMAILEIKSGKLEAARDRLKKLRRLYPENDTILQLQKKLR